MGMTNTTGCNRAQEAKPCNNKRFSKQELSWIAYDVGSSAFILLATALIPIYFKSLVEPGSSVVIAWGYAETLASLILALLMPFLGSLADLEGNKKKFYLASSLLGAFACLSLGFPSHALSFLVIYIIASIMYSAASVFYDAFLIDATTPNRFDLISSLGYAWGYIGSVIPFIVSLCIVLFGESFGISQGLAMKIAFAITAGWWVVFSLPLLKNVKQTHYKPKTPHPIRDSFTGLVKTIRDIKANRPLFLFMLAFFFYIDGVHTLMKMATSYGADLGISSLNLLLALLLTQFVAFPSAIVYGKLAQRFGTKLMLLIAVFAYGAITLFAAFFLREAGQFYILAVLVGMFQGGIQSLSRSEFGKLIPQEHANEYFGFFDIFGKYAAILGTFLVSFFAQITGDASWGVLSISLLFVVGFIILWRMPEQGTKQPQ